MRITMIGDSAVGKTTFMMSTYGLMREGEIEGFQVRCKSEYADKKLIRAYRDFRTAGIYPPATVAMSSYNYDFYSDKEWVINFTLTDIRGEDIHSYDINELAKSLRESDAVMLFLNGYDILNGVDVEDQLDDIRILLHNCLNTDTDPKMLMVVFTQMDRVKNFSDAHWIALNEAVAELKKMADKNDNLEYLAVPTACSLDCMMDLDYAMVSLMRFGYSTEVLTRKKKLEEEAESIIRQYGEGFWRGAKEFVLEFFWYDKERRKARERAAILQTQLVEYEKMLAKFNKLYKFHEDYKLGTSYKIEKRWSSKMDNPFYL